MYLMLQAATRAASLLSRYFDAEVAGLDCIPKGGALLVGNHNGNVVTPDSYVFAAAYYRHFGYHDPLVALAHDFVFRIPLLSDLAKNFGLLPASSDHAHAALQRGRKVLLYPGGGWEASRPSKDRDRIDFAGRVGFLRIAMRARVPIVPVVTAGAHDGWFVLSRGDRLARALGLKRLFRMDVFPIAIGLPTGLIVGPATPYIPLPFKMLIEVQPPITVEGNEDDRDALFRAYSDITGSMQAALTTLASRLPGRQRK